MALKSQRDELARVLCECAEAGPAPHQITADGCSFPKVTPQDYPRFGRRLDLLPYTDNPWLGEYDVLGIYAALAAAARDRGDRTTARRWREHAKMIRSGRAALVDNVRRWRNAPALAAAAAREAAQKATDEREARYLPRTQEWQRRGGTVRTGPAELARCYPELTPGTVIISYPSWSREQGVRPHGHVGVVLGFGAEDVGGVRVQLERMLAPTRLDPRDVVPSDWYLGIDAESA